MSCPGGGIQGNKVKVKRWSNIDIIGSACPKNIILQVKIVDCVVHKLQSRLKFTYRRAHKQTDRSKTNPLRKSRGEINT